MSTPGNEPPELALEVAEAVAAPATPTGPALGQLAVRGGGYMVGREAIGMVIRLVGVVLVVRLIGPTSYGIYSGAAAFVLFVANFSQMGMEVYLIRLPGEVGQRQYSQAFSLLVVATVLMTAGAEGITVVAAHLIRPAGVLVPLRVLLLSVPVNVLWAPAQAAIERGFRYRAMGLIELGGDVALYATAVPLAFLHAGAWSLVAGFFAWQTWLFVASLVTSGLRLRFTWTMNEVREMSRHGITFSSASWAARLGDLVNPIVVGTVFGATGVGYVAFGQRLVDTIAFAKRGAFRLGMVAMSRVESSDERRLRYSIEEGSLLQMLALGIPFMAFALAARWLVPTVFGHEWAPALPVYSLLALATVLGASGFIQATFLYSRGRNLAVSGAALVQSVVLFVVATLLIHHIGLDAYGVAWVASLAWLFYADRAVRQTLRFSYARIVPWVLVVGPPVLFPMVPLPWALLLLAPMLLVGTRPMRTELVRVVTLIRSSIGRQPRPQPLVAEVPAA